ncbi:MAG: chromosome segregation protein SMC [Verrucomicrobiota bacterium]
MHLQSLELFGFKSFADKTVFNFHEGVTAIVGPNGCGKSNVLDAVRWVLGEQSAKALRGGEMADVIFNGTDTRKPVGIAEVSLTFSDCAEELGIDWHDVRVTRRVYRDGQSEYFLNKAPCRLRDINSLFADTGVGRSAYSMMEQGKIDLILSSRPEDRRTIFEEAAGITKYKSQKREALRKLEATEANLLRLGDIIKEVKRQIGSLQRQAGKARRYQALMADLQILDTHHSRRQLDQLEAQLAGCREEIARLSEAEQETQARIETSENLLAAQRLELDEIDDRIGDARAEVQRLQSEIANHRSLIEFNWQRREEFEELIARYQSDIAAAEAKRSQQATQLQEVDALIEKTDRLLRAKETELAEWTEKAAHFRRERAAREDERQTLRLAFGKTENKIAAAQEELNGIAARREATTGRIADLRQLIEEGSRTRDDARTRLANSRVSGEQEQQSVEQLRAESQTAETDLQRYRQAAAEGEKSLVAVERLIAEKESRLEVLRQLNEEGEGLTQGSQAVLKGLQDPDRIRPAIAGALVSKLEVDREFIPAIEAAFGRTMHAVVLQDAKLAAEIVATLNSNKLGQAALAVPDLAPAAPGQKSSVLPEGALAWAIDKVHGPEELQAIVAHLLADVVIVRDLDAALQLKARASHLKLATLSGEFVSFEGIVFGGAASAESDSLLERKSRIDSLVQDREKLEEKRRGLLKKNIVLQTELESAAQRLEEAHGRHRAALLAHATANGQIQLSERALADAERKLEQLSTELTTLEQQIRIADDKVTGLEEELAAHRKAQAEQQSQQTAADNARETAQQNEEHASEMLNDLRLTVATERQRHENLVSQRAPMAAREAELAEMIAARRADIATYEVRLARQREETNSAETAIETQSEQGAAAEKNVASIAEQRTQRHSAVAALETELRGTRNSLNDLRDLRGKQEVRQTQLQLQIENLAEHVRRRYQVDLREFKADHFAFQKTLNAQLKRREGGSSAPSLGEAASGLTSRSESAIHHESELAQIIAEFTRQLDSMGPVNLDAVQEYDELEERHRFLETQNNDLTTSRRELLDVIARINDTTRKLFAETFAQVRNNFREMFAELFGGGRADLLLLDENDPLECGIEITAKPPGKQLQSVSLLSGGERTMTAVALLFAIYMVRPSPFCVLDEMDASLDESNINQFIHVLERFVSQSQFIIITHNKRTIAKADILYGVTMEERGISKLVGMKLTEPRAESATAPPTPAKNKHQSAPEQLPLPGDGRTEREESFAVTR